VRKRPRDGLFNYPTENHTAGKTDRRPGSELGSRELIRSGGRHVAEHVLDRDSDRAAGEAAARGGDDDRRGRIESGRADDPSVV
jgi:hypothetical protein